MRFVLAIGIVSIILAVVVTIAVQSQRRRRDWAALAKRLGLGWTGREIQGTLDGVAVRVWVEDRRGKYGSRWTLISGLLAPDVPGELSIAPHGLASKVGKVLGGQDIELGVAAIDSALCVRAADETEARRWAQSAAVVEALDQLAKLEGKDTFRIEGQTLRLECFAEMFDVERLERTLRRVARLAKMLSGERVDAAEGAQPTG